jgi:hypothetical protein
MPKLLSGGTWVHLCARLRFLWDPHGLDDNCPIHKRVLGRYKDAKKNGATNTVHKKKEKGQEANVSNIALAMERIINDDNSLISVGEIMTEVCCFEQLDANLMETTAVDSTATGTSSSHDSPQVHINLDESVTHHLNEFTLHAFQRKVATNFLSNEFIDALTQYCDASYSSGVSDVNLKDFSEILLKLRSTRLTHVGIELLHSITFHSHK